MATRNTGGTQGNGSSDKAKGARAAGGGKSSGGTKAGDLRSPAQAAAADTSLPAGAASASTGNTAKAKGGAGAKAASARGKTGAKGKADNGKSRADGKSAGAKKSPSGRAGGGKPGKDLQKDLREFVQAHPGGWGHNEWIGLVNLLRDRGHDTSDTDAIGMALERERLILVLERVPGLGPQRVKNIADKYPRLWNLMQSNADEIAAVANIPRATAEKVRDVLH